MAMGKLSILIVALTLSFLPNLSPALVAAEPNRKA